MRRGGAGQQPTEVEAALFSTLDVLGFDSAGTALKVGVTWEPTLFRTSSSKAADAVFHFLFSKWDANRTLREFAGLWPVYDARQSRDFRKTVLALLSELEASGALPPVPNLQAVLAASSGPRFTELLWRFALLCLRLAWQRECQAQARLGPAEQQPTAALCPPTAAPAAVTEEHVTAAEALLSLELKRFLDETSAIASEQESWRAAAAKLTEEFRALQTQKAVAERTLSQLQRSGQGQAGVNAELEIEEALALWKDVDRTAMLLASRSEEVSTAVAEYSDHPHTLDGAALRASPYDRAVDLAKLANDWARSLQLTGQAFAAAGTPEERRQRSAELAAGIAAARADAERRVAAMHALVETLKIEVASSKGAISELQARIDSRAESSSAASGDGGEAAMLTPSRSGEGDGAASRGAAGGARVVLPMLAPATPMVVTEGARGAE